MKASKSLVYSKIVICNTNIKSPKLGLFILVEKNNLPNEW